MKTLILVLGLILANGAQAASYLRTDGTVIDPIQHWIAGDLSYTGANLGPYANLSYVDLTDANLGGANLHHAYLTGAYLSYSVLLGYSPPVSC